MGWIKVDYEVIDEINNILKSVDYLSLSCSDEQGIKRIYFLLNGNEIDDDIEAQEYKDFKRCSD